MMTSPFLDKPLRSEAEAKVDRDEYDYEFVKHGAGRLSDARLKELYNWIVDEFDERAAAETTRRFAGVE